MSENAQTDVGAYLRQLRKACGLTLEQTARSAGITRATLNRWETGKHLPRLPELEAVLAALQATPTQKRQALARMDAPRARMQAQQEVEQIAAHTGLALMPNGGDLLRAMRRRRGLSLEVVAGQVGVTTRTLRLWEKGAIWPAVESLHTLCYVLRAHEQEVVALTCGHFAAPPAKAPSLDAIEHQYRLLTYTPDPLVRDHLREMHLLPLQAQVWPHAARSDAGRQLLAELYVDHANHLSTQDRFEEIRQPAENALALLPAGKVQASFWVRGAIAYGRHLVYRGATLAPERGLKFMEPWLAAARWPIFRAWMLAGMANFHALAGHLSLAQDLSEESCRVAQESGVGGELTLRRIDRAKLLLRAGQPAAALPLLSLLVGNTERDPSRQAHILLLLTEAHLELNDTAASHDCMQQATVLIAAHSFSPLQPHADALALRF